MCIDIQNVFAEPTPWHTPWINRILPPVEEITKRHPDRTVFTRFIPPRRAADMPGSWQRYYERWQEMTLEQIERELLEIVPALRRYSPPARIIDKHVYSPFMEPPLLNLLRGNQIEALIITGAETDVCVLAAVLGAVDCGYRVVIARDAICSSADATHDAL